MVGGEISLVKKSQRSCPTEHRFGTIAIIPSRTETPDFSMREKLHSQFSSLPGRRTHKQIGSMKHGDHEAALSLLEVCGRLSRRQFLLSRPIFSYLSTDLSLIHRPRFRIWWRVRTPFECHLVGHPLDTLKLTRIRDRFGQLVLPKSFVPLGLLVNTSQTRLTHGIHPPSRAMVSSATPVLDRSVRSPRNSEMAQRTTPCRVGASKHFVVSPSASLYKGTLPPPSTPG